MGIAHLFEIQQEHWNIAVRLYAMPEYRRAAILGGTYFFTVVTHERQPFLTNPSVPDILGTIIDDVGLTYPFAMLAWVFLPDHLHCIWTLPEGDHNFSKRWGIIKARFSKQVMALLPVTQSLSPSRLRKREVGVWQRRFWEHCIKNEDDFRAYVDYIHYNPVKHSLVKQVRDWPYSSFHHYVQMGHYPIDWGTAVTFTDTNSFGE